MGFAFIAAFLMAVALNSLDGLLSRIHMLGAADTGLEDVTGSIFGSWASESTYRSVFQQWVIWQELAGPLRGRPGQALSCYLRIDSFLFVPAYAWLLSVGFARAFRKSNHPLGATSHPKWFERAMYGLVMLAVVADELENVWLDRWVREPVSHGVTPSFGLLPLRTAIFTKWIAVLSVVLLGILPSAMIAHRLAREQKHSPWSVLWRLRALLVVIGFYALVVTLKLQTPDAFRRWSPGQALASILLASTLGIVVWLFARWLLSIPARPADTRAPPGDAWVFWIGVALVAVSLPGFPPWGPATWFPRGLIVPGIALAVIGLVGILLKSREAGVASTQPEPSGLRAMHGARVIPGLLAIAPIPLLALGAVEAILPEAVYNNPRKVALHILVLSLCIALPALVAVWIYRVLAPRSHSAPSLPNGIWRWIAPVAPLLMLAYLWWRVVAAPWSFPQALGALGIVALFLVVVAAALGTISFFAEATPPLTALHAVGFRRNPILAFLLAWILVTGIIERDSYHDVRVYAAEANVVARTPVEALAHWLQSRPERSDERRVEPLVFITANGGGIKAAVWTALVLDCIFGDAGSISHDAVGAREACRRANPSGEDRWASVFVASGVSGGSLGLASYQAYGSDPAASDWIRQALTDDFVGPNLAWQLFVEGPRGLLQFENGMDRAEVLERGWERGWQPEGSAWDQVKAAMFGLDSGYDGPLGASFMEQPPTGSSSPILILNGASVEDGCRLIVAPLVSSEGNGADCTSIAQLDSSTGRQWSVASRDLEDFLCFGEVQGDITLSTAALLSARFPYVSPAGRLRVCKDNGVYVHAVDGGYLDNSGGATIAAIWDAVGPTAQTYFNRKDRCVVPFLLQIDSGYGPTPESKTPSPAELTMPLVGFGSGQKSRTIEGRDAAALPFRQPLPGAESLDRHESIYLRTSPEGEAPLGWTMDDSTFGQLEKQLVSNQEALGRIASWFEGAECSSID